VTDNGVAFMRLSHRLRGTLVLVLTAFGLTVAAPLSARADDAATAREHYQKGTSYYDLGRYADAIKEFEAAYEIKNDPALLYNLAQSNRLAGNSEQALHFYRTYLRYVPKAANRAEIEDRIKQLDLLVSQKNATQTPPNQAIPPGTTTPPAVVTPPPPPETPPLTTTPPPGAPTSVPEAPPPGLEQPPMVVAPPPAPGSARSHHSMILAGEITAIAGGALFLVGAAYGAAAVGAANQVNDQAKAGQAFDPSIQSKGKSDQKAEAVFMTLGVVGAAAGGVLFFYGRHMAAQERATVMPVATSTGGGLSLRVTF
jgi:tetratricopeptide (TPR) repeat protein